MEPELSITKITSRDGGFSAGATAGGMTNARR